MLVPHIGPRIRCTVHFQLAVRRCKIATVKPPLRVVAVTFVNGLDSSYLGHSKYTPFRLLHQRDHSIANLLDGINLLFGVSAVRFAWNFGDILPRGPLALNLILYILAWGTTSCFVYFLVTCVKNNHFSELLYITNYKKTNRTIC